MNSSNQSAIVDDEMISDSEIEEEVIVEQEEDFEEENIAEKEIDELICAEEDEEEDEEETRQISSSKINDPFCKICALLVFNIALFVVLMYFVFKTLLKMNNENVPY
eukprot:TRINITY_DN14738_c0_g1_i1.p1 TRINITY_DN14738_c0_g1~~TRINITY_DN14738_c0_g1_i1.p1  ORF type:complete len:117 (+),score=47.11 TRINITY_DN14738_c0_g1_i1:33-353(+)